MRGVEALVGGHVVEWAGRSGGFTLGNMGDAAIAPVGWLDGWEAR